MRTYTGMMKLDTFAERLTYLKLWDTPHESPRQLSMAFYKHPRWLSVRDSIIKRDLAMDLGMYGLDIYGPIFVHHIDPLTEIDIATWSSKCFDPDNLICTSLDTHNTIHYKPKEDEWVERTSGDTKLW